MMITRKFFDKFGDPKFSVIVPVYNVDQYLVECLDSLVNQTLKEIEIICIDDGSTDNSLSILDAYAKNDRRIIIISQENQGQGLARNKGLQVAKGQYIAFVDPDDWIEPNTLELLYEKFISSGCEIVEFNYKIYNDYSGSYKKVNHAGMVRKRFRINQNVPYYAWKSIKRGCLSDLNKCSWTRAYLRTFLLRCGTVFAPLKVAEDHLFVILAFLKARKITCLERYLYNYRCRIGSSANQVSNDYFVSTFDIIELVGKYLKLCGFYDRLREEFKRYRVKLMAFHYRSLPEKSREAYINKARMYLDAEELKEMLFLIYRYEHNSFLESILSVKNKLVLGKKFKLITFLGFTLKVSPKPKR